MGAKDGHTQEGGGRSEGWDLLEGAVLGTTTGEEAEGQGLGDTTCPADTE